MRLSYRTIGPSACGGPLLPCATYGVSRGAGRIEDFPTAGADDDVALVCLRGVLNPLNLEPGAFAAEGVDAMRDTRCTQTLLHTSARRRMAL